ncbi:probable Putative mitochondrial carrier protein PET8 [Saccharomycodes ludwigii]|uniref:Putative mitochondrial carrier protein PET8 n=1 Tax=Saccharomycodes ludwigii TaxID=36035 RepID=A0A376B1M6_9ASCO|nr:hypothetical protein SCDLUD_003476 [Saccharomycodes ludwigii]KAH3900491.1 hypothetical protein SCDLUD_003476 [Saccharomycodes ludwigii]SSD58551.1 probable Putative mitochondrial carrier protein PET8 [Saccharomycodes ludwigii]
MSVPNENSVRSKKNPFLISLISGACAGTATDLVFFPIDTLKTRLQAKGGFFHNGGYRGVYKGLGSAVIASAPSASLFFVTYDSMKKFLHPFFIKYIGGCNNKSELANVLTHMSASSLGEITACLVRVPAEVIKQRTQTSQLLNSSSWKTLRSILQNNRGNVISTLYRGWNTTIMREIPFTCIQFPIYEYLKKNCKDPQTESIAPWKGSLCGCVAGGIAASITTPLDVLKTRLMLSDKDIPVLKLIATLYKEEGFTVFFSGIGPRTMWISMGGAIFLGVYETVHSAL